MAESITPGQHPEYDGVVGEEDVHGHADVAQDDHHVGEAERQQQGGEQGALHVAKQQGEDGQAGPRHTHDHHHCGQRPRNDGDIALIQLRLLLGHSTGGLNVFFK